MNIPQFTLSFTPVASDQLRVDVFMENVPRNFLGTAFDLVAKGSDWNYERYELGSLFRGALSLVIERHDPSRIIFGMSLKRGFLFQKQPPSIEKVVSFYFQVPAKGETEFSFRNTVLSLFDQKRRDIAADFQGAKIDLEKFFASQETFLSLEEDSEAVEEIGPQIEEMQDVEEFSEIQRHPSQQFLADTFQTETSLYQLYFTLAAVFLFLFLLVSIILLVLRRKKRRNPPNY